jgi:hypothetical protein
MWLERNIKNLKHREGERVACRRRYRRWAQTESGGGNEIVFFRDVIISGYREFLRFFRSPDAVL